MFAFIFKALIVWLLMALVAVLNGIARDFLLAPALGGQVALSLSGVSLSFFILVVAWLALPPLFGTLSTRDCLKLGAGWVLATLAFEYLLGYFMAGRTLAETSRVFDLSTGNLFVLVLLATLVSPWVALRLWRN